MYALNRWREKKQYLDTLYNNIMHNVCKGTTHPIQLKTIPLTNEMMKFDE